MSQKSLGKSTDEVYLDLVEDYLRLFPGRVKPDAFGRWVEMNGLLPNPKSSAAKIHSAKLKQAFRRKRKLDPQNRKVREWLPAKIEDWSSGQLTMDVVWDKLDEMSLDHALTAFSQRDAGITKQKRAATRDLESCLENNPNLKGYQQLFQFSFMEEEPVAIVEEKISESAIQPNPLPDDPAGPGKPR